jgi:ribosome-associated heat shock protein Hsp15
MRLDKWLWHARFFKTRSLATRYIEKSRCRIDGRVTDKPHAAVAPGMVLTFALGPKVRVVKITALGERRGPSAEAKALYDEIEGAGTESLARGPAPR